MKYSTRAFHPIEGLCEFRIYDKDLSGEGVQPISVVSAVGRMCMEPGTSWPNGIRRSSMSQATVTPDGAVDALEAFRMRHSLVTEELAETTLRKQAPELGALLGCGVESLVDDALFDEYSQRANTAIATTFDAGVPARELHS